MGEAKRKGTYEQRVAAAIERAKGTSAQGLVFDESTRLPRSGKTVVADNLHLHQRQMMEDLEQKGHQVIDLPAKSGDAEDEPSQQERREADRPYVPPKRRSGMSNVMAVAALVALSSGLMVGGGISPWQQGRKKPKDGTD